MILNKKTTRPVALRMGWVAAVLLLQSPLFLGATAWGQVEGGNLVLNPKFQAGGQPPIGWRITPAGAGQVVAAPENPEGNHLKLEGKDLQPGAVAVQNLTLKPGKSYTLTYAVKAAVGQEYRAYVEWSGFGNTVAIANWQQGTGDWETQTIPFDYPAGVNGAYLVLQIKAPGTAAFADVSLVEVARAARAQEEALNHEGLEWGKTSAERARRWKLKGQASWADKAGVTGGTGLKLAGEKRGDDASAARAGLRLKAGARYRLSYWVKGGGGSAETTTYQYFRVFTTWHRVKYNADSVQTEGDKWQDTMGVWQQKSLEFVVPAIASRLTVTAQVQGPGSLFLDDFKLEELAAERTPPLKLSVQTPRYRHAIFATDPVKQIQGTVEAVKDAGVVRVEVSLQKGQEPPVFLESSQSQPERFLFSIPAEELPPGDYVLKAKALSATGEVVGEVQQVIQKLPRAPFEVVAREDKVFLVNGQPFFPIGLFGQPMGLSYQALTDGFSEWAAAGFNVVVVAPTASLMQEAAKHNMKVFALMDDYYARDSMADWSKAARKILEDYGTDPTLLGYFIADEPLWAGSSLPALMERYQWYRTQDPYRPVYLNEAPRNEVADLAKVMEACDVGSVDIYPVPEGGNHSEMTNRTISSVGDYTDKTHATVGQQKPVWMILQGFAWGDITPAGKGIYPMREESRFMAYDAIVHGATGIIYWGMQSIAKSAFFQDLFRVAAELREMSPVLVSPTIFPTTIRSDHSPIVFLHKVCEGKDYVLAVNEGKETLTVTFTTSFKEKNLAVAFEGREVVLQDGSFSDVFKRNDVHVYTTSERKLSPIGSVKTEIVAREAVIAERSAKLPSYEGTAKWIWGPEKMEVAGSRCFLRRTFSLPEKAAHAKAIVTAADRYTFYVNGKKMGYTSIGWSSADSYDITPYLKEGENVFVVEAADAGGLSCGFLLDAAIETASGQKITILTDENWKATPVESPGWQQPDFKGDGWQKARVIVPYGGGAWGRRVKIATPATLLHAPSGKISATTQSSLYEAPARAQVEFENLIRNPKFQSSGVQPMMCWNITPAGTGQVVEVPEKPDGNYLKLEGKDPKAGAVAVQNLTLKSGKSYTLTYTVKAAVGQEYRAYVEWSGFGNTVAIANWQQGTGDWETQTIPFAYPAGVNGAYLALQLKATGPVCFKDASLVEVGVQQ